MKAIVCKVSDSGKTMLVGCKVNEYTIGYNFAWCANPAKLAKGDDVPNFNPKGTTEVVDKDGKSVLHKDGSPVLNWVF